MDHRDQKYISHIRTGDSAGLLRIYKEFLPRVNHLITTHGGTNDDAMDVFQDALVVMFEKCRQEHFTLRSSFGTFLYGICRNLWGNRLQKKSRTEVTLSEDFKFTDSTNLEFDMQTAEEERIFWDAFRKLGADCQKLLHLFFDQKSMEEIAESMQFSSVGYAKKRKFQCKEQLIERVKGDARFVEIEGNNR